MNFIKKTEMLCFTIVNFFLIRLSISEVTTAVVQQPEDESLEINQIRRIAKGRCKGLWRNDNLVGKCFGLKPHPEYPELVNISVVRNKLDCRTLCCYLGEKCVTWQYQESSKTCRLGPPVRLGFEGANTPDWCDPHPPSKWNGRRVKSREGGSSGDEKCHWGTHLEYQCFGLGPERLSSKGERLKTEECAEACCKAGPKDCNLWQELPERGCYFSASSDAWCDVAQGAYEGGRKCVPGFCGGIEDQILGKK